MRQTNESTVGLGGPICAIIYEPKMNMNTNNLLKILIS
jgi:hypothetical protein